MIPDEARDAPRTDVTTGEGTAQVRVIPAAGATAPRGTLLLGHGAGGSRDAADVLALGGLVEEGWTVVLVDQPWRVAGRRVASRPASLDLAWQDVMVALAGPGWQETYAPLPRPWVVGGRSAGARVACRTSVAGAGPAVAAVVCLAFPLHPPGKPERSRAEELLLPLAAGLPTLVVQGTRDPFGGPEEIAAAVGSERERLTLVPVPGAHSPSRDLATVRAAVSDLLSALP